MALVGRIFLSLIFIFSAIGKIFNWAASNHYLSQNLTDWHSFVLPMPGLVAFFDKLIPLAPFLLVIAIIFEGLGGLMVLFGIQPRLGGVLLLLFLIPTTILMHPFWIAGGSEHEIQMIMFMKNLSIIGGVFLYLACLKSSGKATGKKSSRSKSDD